MWMKKAWETGEVGDEGLAGETKPRSFTAREGRRIQIRKIQDVQKTEDAGRQHQL